MDDLNALLEEGDNTEDLSSYQAVLDTALHVASHNGHAEAIQALLDSRAELKAVDMVSIRFPV